MNNTIRDTGSQTFYDTLYMEYHRYICGFVKSLIADESHAEDIVQETFLAAWLSIDKVRLHPEPRGWLINTAKNKIKHYRRDLANQKRLLGALELPAPVKTGSEYKALALLAKTRPKDADILLMYYDRAMSLREISEALGITEDAAKMRLCRAREKLGKIMQEKKYFKGFRNFCYLLMFFGNV